MLITEEEELQCYYVLINGKVVRKYYSEEKARSFVNGYMYALSELIRSDLDFSEKICKKFTEMLQIEVMKD